ncbi:MAG: hypothetical protein NTZ35_02350 [Ignavibacteriales bacterium]|nr:hypothetical protein [Ignavibacteriales bacterium]
MAASKSSVGAMDLSVKKVKPGSVNSYAKPKVPTGRKKLSSMAVRRAYSFCILFLLALASCTKNSQPQAGATREGDTVTKVQELRDSIPRSLLKSKGVAPPEKISSDITLQEKGSMLLDTLLGSVYVSGNEPFTRLTLALKDGRSSIFIQADTTQSKQLRKLQGRVVRISGSIVKSGTGDYIRVNEFVIVQ